MFNFSLYPYARWLLDGSQGDVPGFNIDESEVPPGDGAPPGGMLAAPPTPQYPSWPRAPGLILGSQNALRSALPGNAPGLWVTPGDNLPGFRVNPQDELIGFKLNENDSSRREGTWPDEMPPNAATPEDPDIAQTFSLPPSVEDPAEPAPSWIPDWLYKLATTPLPPLSTTDPADGAAHRALWAAGQPSQILSRHRPERAHCGERAYLRRRHQLVAGPEVSRSAQC
jgi:hypothetical protein